MAPPHAPSLESPVPGVSLRRVDVGSGVVLRIAEAGPEDGDLVLLLHGFPESWFSWRHQLVALAVAGFRAVAPDMRGYGGSDAPQAVADYSVHSIAADMLGLLRTLGRRQAHLVGHDWGSVLTWQLGLLHPEAFPSICCMSIPYNPRTSKPPTERFQKWFGGGDSLEQKFFYILYHNESKGDAGPAEAEYDADPQLALWRTLTDRSVPKEPPTIKSSLRRAGGIVGRMPHPQCLPAWLSQEDFDYFVAQFTRPSGQSFRGGVNYYRNLDRNWYLTPHLAGKSVEQPTLFIAGLDDESLQMSGGAEASKAMIKKWVPRLKDAIFVGSCGHWVQQEKPAEVNAALVAFLKSLHSSGARPSSKL